MMRLGSSLNFQDGQVASSLFVTSNVPTFHAVLRNFTYKFMCQLLESKNKLIIALTGPHLSNKRRNERKSERMIHLTIGPT